MRAKRKHISKDDFEYFETRIESILVPLLIEMTNEYIDYRNSCYDGVVNQRSNKIEDKEDKRWIKSMDANINEVMEVLDDEYF
jgi:hypothetical protein